MYCCLISSFLFFLSSSALSSSSDFFGPAFCVSNNLFYTTTQMHSIPFTCNVAPSPSPNLITDLLASKTFFAYLKLLSVLVFLNIFGARVEIFLQFPMLELHLDARGWSLLNIISYSFGGAILILLVALSAAPFRVALFVVPRDVRQ